MNLPVTIVFKHMSPSPAVRADVERRAEHLERFATPMLTCRATLRRSEGQHYQGNRCRAHVRVTLLGGEVEAGGATDIEAARRSGPLTSAWPRGRAGRHRLGVVHLASDESKFMTDAELVINGGCTAR